MTSYLHTTVAEAEEDATFPSGVCTVTRDNNELYEVPLVAIESR